MRNHSLMPTAVVCAIVTIVCEICQCTTQIAGASQVGNPSTVAGYVRTTQSKPASGAKVYLMKADFLPELPPADTGTSNGDLSGTMVVGADTAKYLAVADSAGKFSIENVPQQTYNLFISNDSVTQMVLHRNLAVNSSVVNLGTETLQKPGVAVFTIGDSIFAENGYLAVKGTPLVLKVKTPGQYGVSVPGDTVSIVYHTSSDILPLHSKTDTAGVFIRAGDTLDMTGIPMIVISGSLGFIENGVTIPLSLVDTVQTLDSAVRFAVSGAYSNKSPALEYQFFISSDTLLPVLSGWITQNTYVYRVTMPGRYYISSRVRCRAAGDTAVSGWGPTLSVFIRNQTAVSTISRPLQPRILDSIAGPDSMKLFVGTSAIALENPDTALYRFRWIADTTGVRFSPWQRNASIWITLRHGGPVCAINVQVGSMIDSSRVSLWSDTLKVGPFY